MPALPAFTDEQLLAAAIAAGALPPGSSVDALGPAARAHAKRDLIRGQQPPAPTTARRLAAFLRELRDEDVPDQLAVAIVLEAARLEVRHLTLATPASTET